MPRSFEDIIAGTEGSGQQKPAGKKSFEDLVGGAPAQAAPPSKPPAAPTDDQPGFWAGAWSQINPVEAVKGILKANLASEAERQEYAKTHPGAFDQFMHEGAMTWEAAKGIISAPVEIAKDIATDIGWRRYRTAAGKTTGIVAPIIAGYGLKKAFPAKAVLPKGAAAMQKAEADYQVMRKTLPQTPGPQVQTFTGRRATAAMARTYAEREALKESARQAAAGQYATYDKALKKIVEPPGLELRPAEFVTDAEGTMVQKTPALRTTTEWYAPVKTAPFKAELEQLIEANNRGVFPAGHPVKKFLEALGVEKSGVITETGEPALAKGYQYAQFDDLKKALGKLSVYADPAGGTRDAYQGLAIQIMKKARPLMIDKLKEIARKSKVPIRDVVGSMEAGDTEWAKYNQAFGKTPGTMKPAKLAYERQRVATAGKTGGVTPVKGVGTVEAAATRLPGVERKATQATQAEKAAFSKAHEDWVKHLTSSATVLDAHAGLVQTPEVLSSVIDHFYGTKNWEGFSKLKPEVVQRLTAHQPDLAQTIPSVFNQLAEAEKLHGAAATEGALRRAIEMVQQVHKSRVGRTFTPKAVTVPVDILSYFLSRQDSARRLNRALTTQIARIPLTTRVVRAGASAAQAAPLSKAAQALPPPKKEQMAGEQ